MTLNLSQATVNLCLACGSITTIDLVWFMEFIVFLVLSGSIVWKVDIVVDKVCDEFAPQCLSCRNTWIVLLAFACLGVSTH